jgi:hypothetical protein
MRKQLLIAGACLLASSWTAPVFGADKTELIHQTPAKVTYRVTADGLSSIKFNARQVASGSWSAFNAERWFKDGGSGKVDTKKFISKTFKAISPNLARVTHAKGDIVCTTDYRFDGEDVLISARLENNHASSPMNITGFSGLTFHFDRPPDGLTPVQHISYFQAHGVGLCHPGHWSKFGGSYATDSQIGVGTSPWSTGLMRTLTLWDYSSWAQDKREKDPNRRLIYFAVAPIPPRGAATLDFRLRVSPKRDWKHLLGPYKEHFAKTFGAVSYKSDYRWIATDYLNHSQRAISPTNPYGFHGGHRRIDTAAGSAAFCKKIIGDLRGSGGQGVIVWGHGGDDPRAGMYRPDFDILPPEVEARWGGITRQFKQAGLKLGVCTRPRHLAVRASWTRDRIIDINPDDPGHRGMILKRFENMIAKGCTLFYLDSFGSSFEDVKLMRFLRKKIGPNILTFAEHQCDAIMAYSGGYSETSFSLGKGDKPSHYRLWSGVRNWEIYQFLAPGAQMASRLYRGEKDIPKTFQAPDEFFFTNRVTPLLPNGTPQRLTQIKRLQAKRLTKQGQWK